MGAVYVMWLRQIKRYWRSRGRMIGMLGQPILFLFALGFGLGPIFQKAGQGDFIAFLSPGIVAMTVLFAAMFSGIEVIWDKQFGFLKETLVAPVSRGKIMLGRTLGGATVAMAQGIIVFLITLIAGFRPSLSLLALAFFFTFTIAFLFTSIGIAIASKLEDMQAFPIIMNFLIMPIFFLSGALFPLNDAPRVLEIITRFNPLTYGVDGLRGALTGFSQLGFAIDGGVMVFLSVVVFIIGSYLFSKIEI
ncbi:ABC transporter permease [Candidatus Pacearchaeota archaeon]|nr:ABC transporter permease [Candidatus Pacearchaeota archaeon]